jgi:hypothetical protein
MAQLVSALVCHIKGRGFNPHYYRFFLKLKGLDLGPARTYLYALTHASNLFFKIECARVSDRRYFIKENIVFLLNENCLRLGCWDIN